MQGTMPGARRRGRPRTAWIDNIKSWQDSLWKSGWYRSPANVTICPKLCFLATRSQYSEHIQMKFGVSAWTMCKNDHRKIWGFSPPEGDGINRLTLNLACKRRPWVCSSIPNFALIGKGGWVQESHTLKFAKNCAFWPPEANIMNTFSLNLAIGVDHVCTVSCQIWPGSVREHCYNSLPKCTNLVEIAIF